MSNKTELHDKIQRITAKIIDLNAGFASKAMLTQLDCDLLKKYTVDLYDVILQLQTAGDVKTSEMQLPPVTYTTVPVPPAPQKEPVKTPYIEPTPPPVTSAPKIEIIAPPMQDEKPVVMPVEEIRPVTIPVVEERPVIMPVAEEKPVAPPILPVQEKPIPLVTPPVLPVEPKKPLAEQVTSQPVLYDKFEQPEQRDLASKMQQTPIHDLKKAISINKKFEFINQLFKGDHEAYAKSVHYINGLTNGSEAITFFNNLKRQFSWDEENKLYLELADMVRRRFL